MDNQDMLLLVCITALVLIYINNNKMENMSEEHFSEKINPQIIREDENNSCDIIQDEEIDNSDNDLVQENYQIEHFQDTNQPDNEPAPSNSVDQGVELSSMQESAIAPFGDGLTLGEMLPGKGQESWFEGDSLLPETNLEYASAMCNVGSLGMTAQSNRNPNLQLRAEVPNPQVAVSPWNMTTITAGTGQGLKVESC